MSVGAGSCASRRLVGLPGLGHLFVKWYFEWSLRRVGSRLVDRVVVFLPLVQARFKGRSVVLGCSECSVSRLGISPLTRLILFSSHPLLRPSPPPPTAVNRQPPNRRIVRFSAEEACLHHRRRRQDGVGGGAHHAHARSHEVGVRQRSSMAVVV